MNSKVPAYTDEKYVPAFSGGGGVSFVCFSYSSLAGGT